MSESGHNRASDRVHYRACNLCEAICGLEIRLDGDTIRSIRGDQADPFSRGHICAKAVALQDIHEDPDRLRRPLVRRGNDFEEIGWDQAFDEAAGRLREIRNRHGRSALASYAGNPNVHNWGSLLYGPLLHKALRPGNRYSATSVDQLPHHLAAYLMFGHQLLLPVPDIDRTDFFLIVGANPVVSNGSLMTAPDFRNRLKAIRQRGGKVVVLDPRRTETADLADAHYFVRPGSDACLLAAILHTILDEGLVRPRHLAGFIDGLGDLPALIAAFSPEAVAASTGMSADTIRTLARDFCAADAAVVYGRMGVSVQSFGGLCQWLLNLINIASGNFDRPGGAMFTKPAADVLDQSNRGSFARFHSRIRELPEFGGELPVATMAEDILAGGEKRIRALLTVAGNPVLSTPNGAQLDRALASLDYMVSIDLYVNETTRHADLILPPTAALEHDHYDLVFHLLGIRNTARYSPALFEPDADARHDWQIYLELAQRLQEGNLMQRGKAALLRWHMGRVGPTGVLNGLLKKGPYPLDFAKLQAAEHGLDLGSLQPCLPQRLYTRGQRVDLTPKAIVSDLGRLREYLLQASETDGAGLQLISRRQPRSNNSWMHNSQRLVKGKELCTLLVHPDTARDLSLSDADRAMVSSRVGRIEVTVEVSDEIMPGVVSLPHGWGHDRPGIRLRVASQHPGASINDLTDDRAVDQLSGNAALSAVPVTVTRVSSTAGKTVASNEALAQGPVPHD
ncbi:MAG: molybdopterin-dependent oxidoreductase [Gammaproteobacteria bacterium]